MKYVKGERIWLKANAEFTEKWIQDLIANDPEILGLGKLELRDRERPQPKAGRLDLLLQDDDNGRFEVEIQLGRTDESHIIRAIEYWDVERKRYPQYDHCAVIIAEDITSRFLNVMSLFNSAIPLVAIQMAAFKIGDAATLVFTTVLDVVSRGLVEEDEEVQQPATRGDWELRGGKEMVALADKLLEWVKEFDPSLELNYRKHYIGLARRGTADNFVKFRPLKTHFRFEPRLKSSSEIDNLIQNSGLDLMSYERQWGRYRIRLTHEDLKKHGTVIRDLLKRAYENAL